MTQRIQSSRATILVSSLSLLGLPGVQAAPSHPPHASRQAASHAQTGPLIAELHAAKHLLQSAKHDYEGHRARAVHHITVAIRALESHHGSAGGHPPRTNGNSNPGKGENQAQSDALLRQSLALLETLPQKVRNTKGAHHAKSAHAILAAIQEVQIALKIK